MRALIACTLLALWSSTLAAQLAKPKGLTLVSPVAETPQGTVISPLLSDIYRDPPGPFRAGGEVLRPAKISGVAPRYTEEARLAGLQGVVIVEAIIDEHGNVINTRVLKGLPMGLNKSALDTVASWKFKPAILDGKPVKVYYKLTVNFQNRGKNKQDPAVVLLHLLAGDRAVAALPPDAEVLLQMKADLAARRRTLDDAWQWAQGYFGDSRALILVVLGGDAWRQATSDASLDSQSKTNLLKLGEKAENLALESSADMPEALAWKALLLKEKAKGATKPSEKTALLEESDRLFQVAFTIYLKGHP